MQLDDAIVKTLEKRDGHLSPKLRSSQNYSIIKIQQTLLSPSGGQANNVGGNARPFDL